MRHDTVTHILSAYLALNDLRSRSIKIQQKHRDINQRSQSDSTDEKLF